MADEKVIASKDKLDNIADSIRFKTGETDEMTLDEMPEQIRSIEGSGGYYTGVPPIEIDENGNISCPKMVETIPSINLFDNNFDESGIIDTSTGENISSSSYKRTSKFYKILDDEATTFYFLLSGTIAPFVVVFYANDKSTCTGYIGCNNQTTKSSTIPTSSKYFRVYTDNSYNLNSCLSTVYTSTIVSIEPSFKLKIPLMEKSVNIDEISDSLVDRTNLVKNVLDGYYLDYTNGTVSSSSNYRVTSDFIPIESSENYVFGIFNSSNAPCVENNAISVAFYSENQTYISGAYYSGYDRINCSEYKGTMAVTAPSNAKFCKLGTNDNSYKLKWYFSDKASYTKFKSSFALSSDSIVNTFNLQGKVVACFGDSIIGNTCDYSSVPSNISLESGATVYNFGYGGCRMSVHSGDWDKCSMYQLANDIYNENFTDLINAVNNGWSGRPGYFKKCTVWLSNCDFSNVDAIVISYGTNDYREPSSTLDNPNDKYDTTTVCGALRYSIKKILSKYPHIQILVTCPIYRVFFEEGTTTVEIDSDTKDWGSGTLKDYAEAYKKACEEMKVQYLDLYNTSGLNEFTRLYYYPADDGTHPNEEGRKRIGTLIGKKLKTFL